jgi:murein DD-endopeptidase MepM/ murein hydrolase activator NlpD
MLTGARVLEQTPEGYYRVEVADSEKGVQELVVTPEMIVPRAVEGIRNLDTRLGPQAPHQFSLLKATKELMTDLKGWTRIMTSVKGGTDMLGEVTIRKVDGTPVRMRLDYALASAEGLMEKTIAHEIGHELTRQSITLLEVHDYDYKRDINKLEQFYMDIKKEQEKATAPLLARIAELKRTLFALTQSYTRPFVEWSKITQKYGEYDPITYVMTGHHIGTDFAAPLWTAIKAPSDCEVTRSGHSHAMGFWCEVKVDSWYMVCLHLQEAPAIRKYKKGEMIAEVGKTGMIKGIHAHIEGWHKPMDRAKLTRDNWKDLTFDITSKIK